MSNLIYVESPSYPNELKNIETLLVRRGYPVDKLSREVMHPCSELLSNCLWLSEPIECGKIFRASLSSEGYCCSFNYFGPEVPESKISDNDYRGKRQAESQTNNTIESDENVLKPRHVHGAGKYSGLTVTVNISSMTYMSPLRPFYAVIAVVHEPLDFPEFSTTSNIIRPGVEADITVDLSMVISDPDVQQLSKSDRRCLFEHEQKLKISDHYSFSNCVSECRALYIAKTCNCWSYIYPRFSK